MKYLLQYENFRFKKPPYVEIISPSSDDITHNSSATIEAVVKGATADDKIYMKLNGEYVSRKFFTVNKGRLFCKTLFLKPGDNQIKVFAKNENGVREWNRNLHFEKLFELKYTDDENTFIINNIRNILNQYYTKWDSNDNRVIQIDGKIVNTEYISKWLNNRNFRDVITKDFDLVKEPNALVEFLNQNKYDIFNVNGKYFDRYYRVLESSSLTGKVTEERAKKIFEEFCKSKDKTVVIKTPTVIQDKKGIDSIFIIGGRPCTVQIKPLSSVKSKTPDYIELVSAGDVRKIITEYLIVSGDKQTYIIKVPLNELSKEYLETEKTDDDVLDEVKLPNFQTRDSDKVIRFSTELLIYEKK
jgi:hypothetical protein